MVRFRSPIQYLITLLISAPSFYFLMRRASKCGNLEASFSLRDKQDNSKKRHYKALIEKAENLSDRLASDMTALTTEEAQ